MQTVHVHVHNDTLPVHTRVGCTAGALQALIEERTGIPSYYQNLVSLRAPSSTPFDTDDTVVTHDSPEPQEFYCHVSCPKTPPRPKRNRVKEPESIKAKWRDAKRRRSQQRFEQLMRDSAEPLTI